MAETGVRSVLIPMTGVQRRQQLFVGSLVSKDTRVMATHMELIYSGFGLVVSSVLVVKHDLKIAHGMSWVLSTVIHVILQQSYVIVSHSYYITLSVFFFLFLFFH